MEQTNQAQSQVEAVVQATQQVATAVEQTVQVAPFQLSERNYYTLALALLGASKLVLESFGVKVFDNVQIDDIANAVATLLTLSGVILTHIKKK